MSVYGGFATRKQEAYYNKLLQKLIECLTLKVISIIPYQELSPKQEPLNIQSPKEKDKANVTG